MTQTKGQTRRTRLILQVLDKDIERAKALRETFFAQKSTLYETPYPLDLFKQTAMSCLNQPMSVIREDDDSAKIVKRLLTKHQKTITCAPSTLPQLIDLVNKRTPESMRFTLEQLERVDALRALRSRVRDRTSKLSPLLRQQRLYLDQQRLNLRRLRQRVNRQRQEYSAKDYARARRELDELQRALNEHDAAIKSIESRKRDWRMLLQTQLKQFYFSLAGLYATQPFDEEL